jgi:hypothetical protein
MGLKYTSSFDSIRTQSRYIVNIYQESYEGASIPFILAATPVVQEWQEDDPLAPIKGSTLTINLTTSGGLSLLDFYSDNDNEFRVELIDNTSEDTLFDGFILQDDCSEVQVDFIHTITLTATDNLGTLKDITLGRAAELFGDIIAVGAIPVAFVPGSYIVIDYGPSWPVSPGQTFTVGGATFTMISNLGEIDGTYDGWCIQVVENIPAVPPGSLSISYRETVSLDGYVSLMTFIKLCLRATYVKDLRLNVYNHITPTDGEIFLDTGETRIFEDVKITKNVFLNNNEYMSCYEVLEIIMKRFNMSCFQSLGTWWIVRYPDLFLDFEDGDTTITYYQYDAVTFAYIDYSSINKSFLIGAGNNVETGLLKSIIRPYRRVAETLNYNDNNLLINAQLTNVGAFIRVGGFPGPDILYYKYRVPNWFFYDGAVENALVIERDELTNKELQRYIQVDGDLTPTDLTENAIKSSDISLNEGDTFEFSFSVRTLFPWPVGRTYWFGLSITDGTTTLWLNNNGDWVSSWTTTTLTYNATVVSDIWSEIKWTAKPIPFNCIMNIILNDSGGTFEYKNLLLNVPFIIAGQGQINGHTHTATQSKELNNKENYEIFIDNTERSSISGTLFLTTQTGILQDRCTTWKFGYGYNTGIPDATYQNLGQLVTETYMFQRYIPRTKFNGNLLSIRNDNGILSNLAIFSNEFTGPSLHNKMLLGSVAIDYKNDSAEFTMWEVFNKTEADPADNFADFEAYLFNILYEFNYLYENN